MVIGEGNVVSGTSKYLASWATPGFDPTKGVNYVSLHFKAASGYRLKTECLPSQGTVSAYFTEDDSVAQIKSTTRAIRVSVFPSDSDTALYSIDYPLNLTLESE